MLNHRLPYLSILFHTYPYSTIHIHTVPCVSIFYHTLPYIPIHIVHTLPYPYSSYVSILYHTCLELPLVAIPRSSFSLCSQNSRFSFCLPFIYSSICGLIPDNPLKARPLNEIRDLWNRGRGRLRRRNLTFFFFVYSSKIDISKSFISLSF